ncbi:MAG: hypothetical protein WCJ84_01980 [Candidatus Peregrinibacteria bacterium]
MENVRYAIGAFGVLCLGVFLGIMMEREFFFEEKTPLSVESASVQHIPVIRLEKIENGILYGTAEGSELRLQLGTAKEISVLPSGKFSTNVSEILPNLKKIPAPAGMNFVASKTGKYFYALDHAKADTLAVKNRVFFTSEEEAMQKGYKRGK